MKEEYHKIQVGDLLVSKWAYSRDKFLVLGHACDDYFRGYRYLSERRSCDDTIVMRNGDGCFSKQYWELVR